MSATPAEREPRWMASAGIAASLIVAHLGALSLASRMEGEVAMAGGAVMTGLEAALLFGAKIDALVWRGEVWRLLSSSWLHQGWLHLGFNLFALGLVGPRVERSVKGRGVLLVFVGSALGGALMSALVTDGPSVGASGAAFGLVGALAVIRVVWREEVHGALAAMLLPWLVLNVVWGLMPGLHLDNAAHAGGALVGGLLTAALPSGEGGPGWRRAALNGGAWVAAAWVLYAAVSLARQVAICSASGATFYQCHPPAALGLGG
ncbi:MAG: hypothetical protein CMH57_10620 [Myxococcales bacterium]|nr:hypothetical protein [Myxococcales bacterium]